MAALLQELLTRRLVALMVGVDGKTISRWASGEVTAIRDIAIEQRLRTTYEIALLLLERDAPRTVRAWFVGLSPELDDTSPAEALQEGRLKEAKAAARAFLVVG